MWLAILFHFLCAQHVSDINISIIRSLRLFCWITTLVVLFLVRCVLEFRCGNVVIQQNSRKLLMMDILMSETCWAHKKWNKIASDIKLVFYSSTSGNVSLKTYNSLVFITEMEVVYCTVRTESLTVLMFSSFQFSSVKFSSVPFSSVQFSSVQFSSVLQRSYGHFFVLVMSIKLHLQY